MQKKIFIWIGLFLSVSSCNWYSDCNKVSLSKEDGEWFNCCNLGDTIILKSNMENYDSLIVTVKKCEYSPCNKFELGINQYQSILITLKSTNIKVNECKKQLMKNPFIKFYSEASDEEYEKTYRAIEVYNLQFQSLSYTSDSLINYEETPVRLKIPYFKDSLYVYRFDDKNSRSQYPYVNSKYPCAVKSFHWSTKYGLVQYETESGEIYELIFKSK